MIPFTTPRFGEPPHGRNRWDRIADVLALAEQTTGAAS